MTPEELEKKLVLQQMIDAGKINQKLYKYREIGDYGDEDYTMKIITDHTLWFDQPKNFNDPFDCWANVKKPESKDLEKLAATNLTPSVAKICKLGIPDFSLGKMKKIVDKELNEIGVCCFSKTEKNILMWSHYCKYHQGICLEFDVLEDPTFFTLAKPINYVSAMPLYDHLTEPNKLVEKLIQPKSKDWEYEEEVRVIKMPSDISQNGGSRAFKFKPAALKKVIFGCKASDSTIAKYKKLCKKNGLSHITFTKMYKMKGGQFGLEERPV